MPQFQYFIGGAGGCASQEILFRTVPTTLCQRIGEKLTDVLARQYSHLREVAYDLQEAGKDFGDLR